MCATAARLAGVALAVVLSGWPLAAQPSSGTDLLVVVDRSKRMTDGELPRLVLRIVLQVAARSGREMRLRHRFGVIAFGSAATVAVPFTPVDEETLPRLATAIESFPRRDLGDANVTAAFAAARSAFDALPPDPARRRAILILTDGVACVRGAAVERYRRDLRQFVAMHFARGNPTIDVLLVPSSDPAQSTAMWNEIAPGRVHPVGRDRTAVLVKTDRVVAEIAGTPTSEAMPSKSDARLETLVVPPYLDEVVFDVFGASRRDVAIFAPGNAQPISGASGGAESVQLGSVLSTIVVPRPPPGTWIVRRMAASARVRILSQHFFPRGVLLRPAQAEALRAWDHIRITYAVVDADGHRVQELPDYELSLNLVLTKPDGSEEAFAMHRRSDAAGEVFAADRDAEFSQPGRYWTAVRIATTDDGGYPVEVFRDRWSGFSVAAATAVDCRITAEETWRGRISARVACVDPRMRPVEMNVFAAGPPERLFLARLVRDGAEIPTTADLQYLGGGRFEGVVHDIAGRDTDQLELSANRAHLRPAFNVRFVPRRVTVVRGGLRAGILVFSALLLAAVIGFLLFFRRRPHF